MLKAFVAGWPVSHSLSPVLHNYWLSRHGIDGSYEAIAVEPGGIADFISQMPGRFTGGNITIPHKENALEACDEPDDVARAIGAVNTVWLEAGRLFGANTDAYGFAANLDQHAPAWRNGSKALVLGAGGAARAVIHALVAARYSEISILNRTHARAVSLVEHFSADQSGTAFSISDLSDASALLADTDLLVNTTSLGMKGHPPLEIGFGRARPGLLVTDIVYAPLETPLLKRAADSGLPAVDGLGMLLHQAVPGFEKWFGVRPQVDDDLRQHVLDTLVRKDTP